MRHRVVIVGGGFGGLNAAKALGRAPVDVTLIDRRNFHLFQPLLYQVATGALSPGEVASPLRHVVGRNKNTRVLLNEVSAIDAGARELILSTGDRVAYDTLILAAGARHHYFGHPEWERIAPGLKTIEDATEMRSRILRAFEMAERESDPDLRRAWLTFVIIGGGPTGVELAGAVGEIANDTLRYDFQTIDPRDANINLVESGDRVLSSFDPHLSAKAEQALIRLHVRTLTGALATAVDENGVTIRTGEAEKRIAAKTVLWAAGVLASPIGRALNDATGCELDRIGRVVVEPNLTIPGHSEIFVIGDMANFSHQGGKPLPGVCQPAMQQGVYAARAVLARLGNRTMPGFRYIDLGSMATIGRGKAIAEIFGVRLHGYIAWLTWLFIHLMYLIEFDNRLLVLVEWAYNYVTRNRGARLITGTWEPTSAPDSARSPVHSTSSVE